MDRGSNRQFLPLESTVPAPWKDAGKAPGQRCQSCCGEGRGALGGCLLSPWATCPYHPVSPKACSSNVPLIRPREAPARTNRSTGPRRGAASSPCQRHGPGLLCASVSSPRKQEGWTDGVLLVPSISLLSVLPSPSYSSPQTRHPDKLCPSGEKHRACEDFSQVLSMAPTSEAPKFLFSEPGLGFG